MSGLSRTTGAQPSRQEVRSRKRAGMKANQSDKDNELVQPDLLDYPQNGKDRSSTYIWPRLGASPEDTFNPEADDVECMDDHEDADHMEAREDGSLSYLARELDVDNDTWKRYVLSEARGLDKAWTRVLARSPTKKEREEEKSARGVAHPDGGHVQDIEAGPDGKPLPHGKEATPQPNPYWTFDPFSPVTLRWRVFITLFDATYSAFYLPISVGWHEHLTYFTWFNVADFVGTVVYLWDIIMGFTTGFIIVHNLKRRVVRRPDLIAKYYIFHSTFFVDLFTVVPVAAEIVELAYPGHGGNTVSRCIILARYFRLVRVFKLAQWLVFTALVGQMSKRLLRFMNVGALFLTVVTYAALVLINFLGSVWFFTASLEGLQSSWLNVVGSQMKNWTDSSGAKQWVASVYFITVSITSIGYGDISASTPAEMLVSICINLLGIIFLGFVISTSQELIKQVNDEARRVAILRTKMQAVETWNQRRGLSNTLRKQIRTYFAEVWLDHNDLQNDHVFNELPSVLQTGVAFELTEPLLAQSHIFGPLKPQARRMVTSRLKPVSLPAGHDLCKVGDCADCLWILQDGELLSIDQSKGMELIHAPAILGEAAVLGDTMDECAERQATLRAVTNTALWRLDSSDIDRASKMYPELKLRLMDAFREHLLAEADDNPAIRQEAAWKTVMAKVTREESNARRAEEAAEDRSGDTSAMADLPDAEQEQLESVRKYAKHWRAVATGIGPEDNMHTGRQAGAAGKIMNALVSHQKKMERQGSLVERG
ncbi:hypothetical protein WJX73_004779 [Symbiochloris irregularis]|uniref:Cyclic nucleotide-binding domain-containing protein n=1 Tax=Symbiochloris irregularis TaxID=706552 RepID=A0AAW1NQ33_9CHLO